MWPGGHRIFLEYTLLLHTTTLTKCTIHGVLVAAAAVAAASKRLCSHPPWSLHVSTPTQLNPYSFNLCQRRGTGQRVDPVPNAQDQTETSTG
jgi:hypothetical protein